MVNILGFNLTPYKEYVSKGITVLEQHREHIIDTGREYYYIELPKFRNSKPNLEEKLNQWLAFIDYRNRGMVEMAKEKNEVIKEAEKELEYLTGEEEVRRMAFLHEKWEMDYISGIEDAKDEARTEGRAEGRAKGKIETKIEIAKRMLAKNLDKKIIMEFTELTEEELKTINRK